VRPGGRPFGSAWSTLAAPVLAVLAPAAFVLVVLLGCAGAPERTPEKEAAEHAAVVQATLQVAQRDMEVASVSSLGHASRLLSDQELRETPEGQELAAFGSRLFAGLYPELQNPFSALAASTAGGAVEGLPARGEARAAESERGEAARGAATAPTGSKFFQLIGPALSLLSPGPAPDDAHAAEILDGLTVADPGKGDSVLPPYLRALLLERQGRPPETIRPLYEDCLRRDPAFYPAKAGIIRSAIDEGNAAAEQQTLLKLAADLPTPLAIQTATARILLAAGQPRQAADTAARALLQAPDSRDLVIIRAQAFDAMGDWYQSLSILDALLSRDPTNSAALVMKADLLFEKAADPDGAMQIASRGEALFPDDPDFPELRGRILLARGNSVEGHAALAAALRLDPSRVTTLSLLAASAAGAGRWQEAAGYLERVPESRRNAGLLRLGWQIAMKLEDYDGALAMAHDIEKKETDDARLLPAVRTLVAERKSREAMDLASADLNAAKAADVRASLYALRAFAARQAGGYADDVLADLRTALRENPDDREALVGIADVLKDQREYRKALTYLKHAQELSPGDASVRARVSDMSRLAESQD